MSDTGFVTAIFLGFLVGAAPAALLGPPLSNYLLRVCGDRNLAIFWARYIGIMLTLAPALSAGYLSEWGAFSFGGGQLFSRALLAALLGEIVALIVVGLQLSGATREAARMARLEGAPPP